MSQIWTFGGHAIFANSQGLAGYPGGFCNLGYPASPFILVANIGPNTPCYAPGSSGCGDLNSGVARVQNAGGPGMFWCDGGNNTIAPCNSLWNAGIGDDFYPYTFPSKITKPGAFRMTIDNLGATPQTASQVYNDNTISLTSSIDMTFNFFFGCRNLTGGDGMIFVLAKTKATPASGSAGGGNLGFFSIGNSIGIEFDTYRNAVNNDPTEAVLSSTDHVAIVKNGSVVHPALADGTFPAGEGPFNLPNTIGLNLDGNIEDCTVHKLRVVWNQSSKLLTAYLDGIKVIEKTEDIPTILGVTNAYWGFTSGVQGNSNEQWFSYNGTASPPSIPYDCSAAGTDVLGCTPIALPVEFFNINSQNIDNKEIVVRWSTAWEKNNSYFMVERSTDMNQWKSLGTVNGTNLDQLQTYDFVDLNPENGVNYYRLIQVDNDGAKKYSSVVREQFNTFESIVSIVPNPASNFIKIKLLNQVDVESLLKIEIRDIAGKMVYSSDFQMNALQGQEVDISINGFSEGLYLVKTTIDNVSQSRKLIIQH